MKNIIKKLNNRGESLAEAMVAILIGAIAIFMLASFIYTGTNMVNKSSKELKVIYDGMSALEVRDDSRPLTTQNTQLVIENGKNIKIADINIKIYTDDKSELSAYEKIQP